jgi:signal transduction histidine kinase
MKLGAVENRARVAMAVFVLALFLTIGLSLVLYWQARADLDQQRVRQLKLEALLLASDLSANPDAANSQALRELLRRHGVTGHAALYSPDGVLLAFASTVDRPSDPQQLGRIFKPSDPATLPRGGERQAQSADGVRIRSEDNLEVAEVLANSTGQLLVARPVAGPSSPFIFYVLSYQIVALVLGLGLIFLVARWLLKPYHRMVEAARGSPVHVSSAMSESEFVVGTFQALIEQLQAKEKELAQLHAKERERAEKSERFSGRLVANIPSGLVTVDSAGKVTAANTHALAIFGPVEPAGQGGHAARVEDGVQRLAVDYRDFFSAAPKIIEMVDECLSQGAAFRRAEVDVTKPDGRVRHLGMSISPMTDPGRHDEGALCLMTDITEVTELRERMKLQESLANLGEMAAGLAHEFKNSLATISGYVQLVEAQTETEGRAGESRRTLDATLNEVRLLARLVTDFLNFARPQHLSLSPLSLRAIIEDCAKEVRPRLDEAGIKLSIEGDFPDLLGDESLLTRAFANLLRNAAEAIDPDSQDKLIEVTGSADEGGGRLYAHIRIRDTGGGISREDLHRIFIPFFTTKSRGYGIGLAIVQKIFMAHSGEVAVERSDSAGTVFHCRLPLSPFPFPAEERV